jgi:hypothetical protein
MTEHEADEMKKDEHGYYKDPRYFFQAIHNLSLAVRDLMTELRQVASQAVLFATAVALLAYLILEYSNG